MEAAPAAPNPIQLAATARLAPAENGTIQSETPLGQSADKAGTSRAKISQKPGARNQCAAEPVGRDDETPQGIATPADIAPAVVTGNVAPPAQPALVSLPDGAAESPAAQPLGVRTPALSGIPARTAPQPAAAATAASAERETETAQSVDSGDGGEPGQALEVAFTATLKPLDAALEDQAAAAQIEPPASPRNAPVSRPRAAEPEPPAAAPGAAPPADDNTSPAAESSSRPMPAAGGTQPEDEPERWRKSPDNLATEPAAASAGPLPAHTLGTPDAQPAGNANPTERPAAAETPIPVAGPPTEPATDPARPAATHDITLQVGGAGDSRVEVRVTERGGDVHVAVRTPDTRLAGELREDLPALASRLEQSGFHAETWRPAAAGGQHFADPRAGATAQDAQGQSGQNGREQPRDPQEQNPKDPENPDNPSQPMEPGKDFAWLLSSLR
jgi:hypothetical protein